jgi:hypothetical protein
LPTKEMTEKEKAISYETLKHITNVRNLLNKVIREVTLRSEMHDWSKLENPELATFVKYTPKLAGTTYGSNTYKQYLKEMKPALDHHYVNNRHHPEYFKDKKTGIFQEIDYMNLIDILEMLCDWIAATKRHTDGDVMKSIEINQKRFLISEQLVHILRNTVSVLEK